MMMFATPAFAQAAGSAAPSGGMAFFIQIVPLLLIFVIFYFLLFRPQQHQKGRQRGDRGRPDG
jgi:preprotein translocase subunit YajC